jgi:hypothetical protein
MSEGNGNNPQAPNTALVLTITLDQLTGAVQVNGPIQNPMICMGMMEMAKQAIHDFAKEQAKGQRIVPAAAMPMIRNN